MQIVDVETPVTGVVWKVWATIGDDVAAGDVLLVVESMKMEIPVESPVAGTVVELLVAEGDAVGEDDPVARIEPA
jgi:biotin carboxyl carrier protein